MHSFVEDGEKILDKEYKVLDKGFVRLVDYLGSDERIVQSARVSYGEGTKTFREDSGLINYLMRNNHTSPFEQVVFTFHLKMPIFVARQWVRHRTGRMNEISGRYSVMKEEYYIPSADYIAYQSEDNKQGRKEESVDEKTAAEITRKLSEIYEKDASLYRELLALGIAKEIARMHLPLSLYTEFYWQMDLHNLFHFLSLRMDKHAQREIRDYADTIFQIVKIVCPISAEAFLNHRVKAKTFSSKEVRAIKNLSEGKVAELTEREKRIFDEKLK